MHTFDTYMDPRRRRSLLRRAQALRIAGFAILLAGVAVVATDQPAALLPAVAAMLLGALVACGGALALARFETTRDPGTRNAVRLLVGGFALKLLALPLVTLGGGWLAWGGADATAAAGTAALGVVAYVYGMVARIDGLSMLPSGAAYA